MSRVGSPQRIGQVLGSRYALYDDVGGGPLAHVYGAWDQRLNHRVAVKMLDSRFLDRQQVVRAFEGEARRVVSLPPHRSIVSVHDVERDGQCPYIVMEYIAGQSLRSVLDVEAPLSIDRAFDIGQQVARGLDFAHEYGIIHGNLKPENILLSRNGQAKATDFGTGHAMDIAETFGALLPLSRRHYMSPEQTLGREPGPPSDVYSLGVVLFEMLTGRLPFQYGDFSSKGEEYRRSSPHRLQSMHPTIPAAVWSIILRALERNPEGRYRTAGAFASALHQYLLVEAGLTVMNMPAPAIDTALKQPPAPPPPLAIPPPPEPSGSQPLRREGKARNPLRLTVVSLVFVVALLVALVGGWLTYRAISELLNQWDQFPSAGAGWTVKNLQPLHSPVVVEPGICPYIDVLDTVMHGSSRSCTASTHVEACSFTFRIVEREFM